MANDTSYGTTEQCGIRITCPRWVKHTTWHSTYSCHVHIKCDARNYYLRRGWFRFWFKFARFSTNDLYDPNEHVFRWHRHFDPNRWVWSSRC